MGKKSFPIEEAENHYLKFDSPHIYKCTCGVVMYWFQDGTQKVADMPRGEIEYLPCGHAVCARTEMFKCIICVMKG